MLQESFDLSTSASLLCPENKHLYKDSVLPNELLEHTKYIFLEKLGI